MLESLFNKVAGPQACNFIKKIQYRYVPVKFAKFVRTPILKIIFDWAEIFQEKLQKFTYRFEPPVFLKSGQMKKNLVKPIIPSRFMERMQMKGFFLTES